MTFSLAPLEICSPIYKSTIYGTVGLHYKTSTKSEYVKKQQLHQNQRKLFADRQVGKLDIIATEH